MLRQRSLRWAVLATVLLVLGNGCTDNATSPVQTGGGQSAQETLTAYLAANNLDLPDLLASWIVDPADVASAPATYHILDIRSASDFAAGHIDGAVNSSLANVLTDATGAAGKPILVVCKTGQTAGHAVMALRLSGYADAVVLKWGMSGWDSPFDSWTANTGNIGTGHANWSLPAATATLATFAAPTFTSSYSDGASILAERVAAMLAGGFKGVNASDVLAGPGGYFINNYWAQTDVDTYGHIAGAYRIKETLNLADGGFANLDPDATVVTYCWTGQTSSMITAYLTVLGYDALSLKFGANAMIYDALAGHKWSAPGGHPWVTK
jgi:rhodanese-related sulfurtransferase